MSYLLAFAAVDVGLTALVVHLLGRRLVKHGRALASMICGAIIPLLIIVLAVVLQAAAPTGPPPNDAPAMLFVGLLMLAMVSVPVSLATSTVMIFRGDAH